MAPEFADYVTIVVTLVVLEATLSFDNAAILAVMSRRLPVGQGRRRALNYGLLIAYALRILVILAAVSFVNNPAFAWVFTLGGLYLLFLAVRHFWGVAFGKRKPKTAGHAGGSKKVLGMTPFGLVILQIGFIDLAFALDQVIAAVSFTQDPLLIIIAAAIGLLALRLVAPYLSRLMDWLPLLEHMAYIAVGLVGAFLLIEHPDAIAAPLRAIHLPQAAQGTNLDENLKRFSTLALFVVPIFVKFFFGWPKSRAAGHSGVEKEIAAAQAPAVPGKKR